MFDQATMQQTGKNVGTIRLQLIEESEHQEPLGSSVDRIYLRGRL